jgi:Asp-tRNA(Asn)/Glu-tRNA(Gln) amidotransferase A subunit family amidase
LTIVRFEEAIERAKELDRYFEKTGELVGPLHGVPISLKDHFKVKGSSVTLGFSSWLDRPVIDHDGALAVVAKHLGAVPFVKTNIPQTMLAFETCNPLWGRTTNPYNSAYTSGGSSGGEAALLACGGTPIGLGSDIGGSLRIPAGYCGLYSLKTTARRWPVEGSVKFAQGFEGVVSVYGPMARTAQDLELVFSHFSNTLGLNGEHSDMDSAGGEDHARQVKLRDEIDSIGFMSQPVDSGWFNPLSVVKKRKRPLRIGYFLADGFVKTSPACYRAVLESVEAIKKKYPAEQVELKRLYLPDDLGGVEAIKIFLGMSSADGYDRLTDPHLGKDKVDPTLTLPLLSARIPGFLRAILSFIAAHFLSDWMMAIILKAAGRKSAGDYFKWIVKRDEFREAWKRRVWNAENLDAIIW